MDGLEVCEEDRQVCGLCNHPEALCNCLREDGSCDWSCGNGGLYDQADLCSQREGGRGEADCAVGEDGDLTWAEAEQVVCRVPGYLVVWQQQQRKTEAG